MLRNELNASVSGKAALL